MGADPAFEEQFGPYRVFERLGIGGMATVHRALERTGEGAERVVALKRLLPHLAEDASFIKAFVREAKLASLLDHIHIVQIYELGRVGTAYFITMEYIDGRDVRQLLRQARRVAGPPPMQVTVGLAIQLAEALDYAHNKVDEDGQPLGLVHRDVSPSNLLVTNSGQLKVIDFGIAKAQSSQLRTQTGRVKGKLAYMAPEAISSGKDLDARSDIWAMGVILHELVTARPLFASRNEYQTLLKVQRGDILPPSTFNQACPPEIDAIVLRALARDPDDRFAHASELRDELVAVRERYGLQTGARDISAWIGWAFSLETPDVSGPISVRAKTPTPLPVPEDDEAVDLAWGGNESGGPIALDEVPDVSSKHALAEPADSLDDIPTPIPSHDPGIAVARPSIAGIELGDSDDEGDTKTNMRSASERPASEPPASEPPASEPSPLPVVRFSTIPPPVSAAPTRPRARPPTISTIGASMIERRTSKRGWLVSALAILVLGGSGAAFVMKTRGRDEATRPAPAMQTTTRTSNTLKFVTEPTDAEVHVAGLPPHAGSPWTTELPTGVYQVEIHRSGYKAWLTSIELAGAETQTLRVVLQPLGISGQIETASLAITTTPPGLDVVLDGKLLNEKTPLRREVDVGPHAVAVRRNGIEMWRQSFKAEPNSDYEFNPSFTAHAARASTPPAVETTPAPPDAREEPKVEATTVAADAGVEMPPPPAPLPVPVPAPPPAPVAAPNQVFVVARAVKRLSGGTPNIDKSKYTELPSVISVKLCIDTHGTVASVDVLTRVDAHTATVLADTLRTWKYAPYKQGATAVSACFSVPFRVK